LGLRRRRGHGLVVLRRRDEVGWRRRDPPLHDVGSGDPGVARSDAATMVADSKGLAMKKLEIDGRGSTIYRVFGTRS
jgi:hypothetical protein